MSGLELTAIIREYREWKQMAEEAAARLEELKATITAEMDAMNVDKMNVDVFTVKNITVTTQRLDTKSLQKENADIYSRYFKPSSYKRFTIA